LKCLGPTSYTRKPNDFITAQAYTACSHWSKFVDSCGRTNNGWIGSGLSLSGGPQSWSI